MHKVGFLLIMGVFFAPVTALAGSLKIGQGIFPPIGFIKFCAKNKGDCLADTSTADTGIIDMDYKTWQTISAVQKQVNAAITPAHDQEVRGVLDDWSLAENGYGDCEDYALRKRQRLLQEGLPASALLLTTAITEQGERHVVLSVVTSMGDIILDNRFDQPRFLDSLDYYWLARQDADNRLRWRAAAEQPEKKLAGTVNPFASYAAQ